MGVGGRIVARVFRFNPEEDPHPSYMTYEIETETPMTVHRILKHIHENMDPTLAFRDYTCISGVCGGCLVKANGSPVRGCQRRVDPGEEVVIEPQDGYPVIRDVVTDFGTEVSGPDGTFILKRGTLVERKYTEG